MKLKQAIYKQFGRPTGNLGRLVGWMMALKNRDRSSWTLTKLNIRPTDYILEIGYGPGVAFKQVAKRLTTGFIGGIDHSEVMLEQATERNITYIRKQTAKLECGTVTEIAYPKNYFDIVFGSNVHFFWTNPVVEFQRLYNHLKPQGRLVMVFQPRWAKSDAQVKEIAEKTRFQYEKAGFTNVEIEFKKMFPVTCIYISGEKIYSVYP
jgi:trans-aconitate methyltransferase